MHPDKGCSYHPKCLTCPLALCRYEEGYDLTKAIILTKKIDEEKARRAHLGSQAEAAAAEAIIAMVAKDHGITVRELRNRRRYSHLCAARYEAYHRLRQMDMTLKRIGLVMGGRDHATILYGLRQAGAA